METKTDLVRFAISTVQIEDDKPNSDGDQKHTNEKITYKTNEGCPLMDKSMWPLLQGNVHGNERKDNLGRQGEMVWLLLVI